MSGTKLPEPWLRGTLADDPALPRAVLYALELAGEDLRRWCDDLTDEEISFQPDGLVPVAFHLRHIARSVDRLLTYAEENQLDAAQIAALRNEESDRNTRDELFAELDASFSRAAGRIRALGSDRLEDVRLVGLKQLPTTLAGLLVHVADHTQRHVGQAVTTSKIVRARRSATKAQR